MSPGNFVLEELTCDHVLPMRCEKPNTRPRNKTVFISDSKFLDCLQNPNDLLQSVSAYSLDNESCGLIVLTENYSS